MGPLFTWLTIKWKSWSKVCWIFQQFLQQSKMVIFNMFFHGCYAIRFMVCNGALPTSCVHGQDFKRVVSLWQIMHLIILFLERLIG